MTGRAAALATTAIALALMSFTMTAKPLPRLLWNASASVPIGLYGIVAVGKLAVGNLVVATPPKPLATVLALRGYLPLGVPLIKRVFALSGQSVCRKGLRIAVDGVAAATALAQDSRGRALPAWQGCRVITPNEVFLMNSDEAASFDGRYFGPISLSVIVGCALPLWTFAKQ
jgi:conjugative transfer signal peptidase TraF